MSNILFYGSVIYYYINIYMTESFPTLGKEFVCMIVLGLIANIHSCKKVQK
jgi:hypothetical protein